VAASCPECRPAITVGLGREQLIYYETRYAPLLHMQGSVREVAMEVVRADGSRLPAPVNRGRRDEPLSAITGQVFDALHGDDTCLLVARLGRRHGSR
jgi:hypothetical protein